jgi:hypothetical protein
LQEQANSELFSGLGITMEFRGQTHWEALTAPGATYVELGH